MFFAKRAVNVRGLKNVVYAIEWIEGIPRLGLGEFNFEFSTGVLHHLKSPHKGLNILKSILSDVDGGCAIMVYGKYGRSGVYHIQNALRYIHQNEEKFESQVKHAKSVLNILPETNWFQKMQHVFTDHQSGGDSGIYDLLLHTRDVSYSIPDVEGWLKKSGSLNFVDFATNYQRIERSLNLVIRDNVMYKKIRKTKNIMQKSVSELLTGNLRKHEFYVSKLKHSEASAEKIDNVVFLYGSPTGFQSAISNEYNHVKLRNQTHLCAAFATPTIRDVADSNPFGLLVSGFSDYILSYLTRKPTKLHVTIQEMILNFKKSRKTTKSLAYLHDMFKEIFLYLKDAGLFLLKKPNIGMFPKTCCHRHYPVIGLPNCLDYI